MYVHIYAKHISFASPFSVHSYAAHTWYLRLESLKHSLNIIKSICYRNSTPENRQTFTKPIDRAQNPILFNTNICRREKKLIILSKKKSAQKKWKWPRNVLCEWHGGIFAVQREKNERWNCCLDSRTMKQNPLKWHSALHNEPREKDRTFQITSQKSPEWNAMWQQRIKRVV